MIRGRRRSRRAAPARRLATSSRTAWVAALAALPFLAACGDDNNPMQVEFEVIEEVEFDPSLEIDLSQMTRLESGVYIQDLVVGTNPVVAPGEHLSFDYTGWLRTGVQFDSGHLNRQYIVQPLIVGMELGLLGMGTGGVRKMIIPPALAYGAQGSGPIPPGAILVFEVHLISVT